MSPVLVVEDDAVYRGALCRALRREGFEPIEAEGVESATRMVTERPVELALIDLNLGDGSGIDVVRALGRVAPACRSVVLTAYGTIPTAVEAMRAGAVDFRTKPISTAELVEALRRAEETVTEPAMEPLDQAEREHIHRVLDATGGNISEAARRLGLHRRTLQRKLQKLPPLR
jgi:two-component system response regulator RegA